MTFLFAPPNPPSLEISGSDARFPVNRIFCVGRNYEAHAREMGFEADREAPIWFTKSPAAVCHSGATIPYPPGTANCHYEVELVIAIDKPAFRVAEADALSIVAAYGLGIDLTRRDLQGAARDRGLPWDTGKDFENAAVLGRLTSAARFTIADQRIALTQNGDVKQDAPLSDMIWSGPELIADLSRLYHLAPGDLIYTGTPAGVGAIAPGDTLVGTIDGLDDLVLTIGPAE